MLLLFYSWSLFLNMIKVYMKMNQSIECRKVWHSLIRFVIRDGLLELVLFCFWIRLIVSGIFPFFLFSFLVPFQHIDDFVFFSFSPSLAIFCSRYCFSHSTHLHIIRGMRTKPFYENHSIQAKNSDIRYRHLLPWLYRSTRWRSSWLWILFTSVPSFESE